MHHERVIFGTIKVERRENSSASGNPRFLVYVQPEDPDEEGAFAVTKPDDGFAYGIENHEVRFEPHHYKVGLHRNQWTVVPAPGLDEE